MIVNVIRRFTALQHDTAEQRYLGLLHHSPQKYLASYVSVTPTSLSHIRRKLA